MPLSWGARSIRWVGAVGGALLGGAIISLINNVIFFAQIPYQFQSILRWDRFGGTCGRHIRLEETRMSQLSTLPHSAIRNLLFVRHPVWAILAGIVAMLVLGELLAPGFASRDQVISKLSVAAILGIVAAGQGLVILAGREGIDLSVAAVMSLSALVAGDVMGGENLMTLPALAVALAVGFAVGLFNGFGVALLRIPPLVMTLGSAGVIAGLLVLLLKGQTQARPRLTCRTSSASP